MQDKMLEKRKSEEWFLKDIISKCTGGARWEAKVSQEAAPHPLLNLFLNHKLKLKEGCNPNHALKH